MTDIVERLRKIIRICGEAQETKWIVDDVDEAITHLLTSGAKNIALATEIRKLRAENARLREALVEIADGEHNLGWQPCSYIARRALSDAPKGGE